MSISVECPSCRTLNSASNSVCSKCSKRINPLNRKYWIRYRTDGQSKKVCLGIVSYREAKAREMEILSQRPVESESEGPTWALVTEKFIAKLIAEQRSKNYINDTRLYLNRFHDFIGSKGLNQINAVDIKEFKTRLRSSQLSEATCDRHLQAGKAAWNYAVEDIKNPFTRVKLFNPENITERFLSAQQRSELLLEAKKISQTFFEIMVVTMNTGFRKAEVLNLMRSQVNFDSRIITIKQKRSLLHTTYMNDLCWSTLKGVVYNGSDYFWISRKTARPYRNDWRSAWDKARKRAGLPDDFRWHDLRHDVGTAVYAATHDLQAVQRFLGHRQIKTTQRYAHTQADYLREISETLYETQDACPTRVLTIKKRSKNNG